MAWVSDVASTKDRILDNAWNLMRDRGLDVTISDIASAAAVSRQAVYLHFGSRSGLLVGMARHRDRAAGMVERLSKLEHLEPIEHFNGAVTAWLAHIHRLEPVGLALYAASLQGDVDAAAAWTDRMADLREVLRHPIARLGQTRALGRGWTVPTATDWVWTSTHLTQWHHLVRERGWSERRAAAHLAAGAALVLVERP